MVKRIFVFIFAVVLAVSNTGCGRSGEKENTVTMWLVGSEAQARLITELGKEFTKETGVKVSCQAISWGDAHSKYLTSIAGNVVPDIGTMGLTWGMEFGGLGALVDLRDEYPEDFNEIESKIFPSIIKSTRYGDKVFGIPFDVTEHVMYYRTDIIPTPPDTWGDLLSLLKDLRTQNKGALI